MTPNPQSTSGSVGRSLVPLLVVLALALVFHFLLGPFIGEFRTAVVKQMGIAVIAAVSLNIVNGFTGQFSMGHAGFMTVGGYVGAFCTYYGGMYFFGSTARVGGFMGAGEWLLVGGCLTGGLFAALCGYAVGLPSLRLRGDYLAIVTLGFGEIVRTMLQQTGSQGYDKGEFASGDASWWPLPVGGAQGFKFLPSSTNLFWVWLFAGITILAAFRLKQSSMGRAFLSIREDEIAARAMGIDLAKYKVRAFVLAAFFAGIAGVLLGHSGVNLSPSDAGFLRSFELIIMVVLGGLGSISGAVVAAVILSVLPELLRDFAQFRLIVYALLLIIMMLVRPQGLFGISEAWDIFRRPRRVAKKGVAS